MGPAPKDIENLETPLNTEEQDEEECLDWGDGEEEVTDSSSPTPANKEQGDGSLCVAICTLCAAVPALVGSWCWPILVGAIFAVAAGNVNGGLVDFFHGVQVAVMMTLMTNIVQFAYWNVQKKRKGKGHWHMYKPVYLLMVATVLVMVQPTCMLVIGSWNLTNFFFENDPNLGGSGSALVPNTVIGWMIQIFGTYLGFACMFVGVCQATMLHHKIVAKWKAIRNNA